MIENGKKMRLSEVPSCPARKRVMMVMDWEVAGHYRGVVRQARRSGWTLEEIGGHDIQRLLRARPDGIIMQLRADSVEMLAALRRLRVPMVQLSDLMPDVKSPRVMPDFVQGGKETAEHFLERRFRHFLCLGHHQDFLPKRNTQANGFLARVAQAGYPARRAVLEKMSEHKPTGRTPHISLADPDLPSIMDRLLVDLQGTPKPVAVFVPSYNLCMELLDACIARRFHIPEEIAFATSANEKIVCELAAIPVSCTVIDYEAQAFRAAELLDDLLRGKPVPAKTFRVPPREFVVHESSNTLAVPDLSTALSLRYLIAHLTQPGLSVPQIAKAMGTSSVTLHRWFRVHLQETVAGMIQNLRVEKCVEYMKNTDLDFQEIARLCGYTDTRHLRRALQRKTGMTPRDYRNSLADGK